MATLKDEIVSMTANRRKEAEIIEAADCEIVQLCFYEGHVQLLSADSLFNLVQWDLLQAPPVPLKKVKIPEDPNYGFVSCIRTLAFQSSDARNM